MSPTPGGTPERPALFFSGPEEFRVWLRENHDTATELWMGLRKKHVPDRGLTWADAVVEALCFGWIDSVAQRIDADAVRQRWTPRKPGSTWSRINLETVARLIEEGRMTPAGLAAYERRKADRQAIYAYEQAELEALPAEAEEQVRANPAAAAFLDAATASYRKVCIHWVLSAKQEATREKRLRQLIDDSAAGRLVPSQRYGQTPSWVARAAAAAQAAEDRSPPSPRS
ncbi:hypothetical protein FE374_00570 [Georgenia yuyongxinii]|uniref:Bacteriocin-protection protein n=1 Tax=Georgenia yuyongxinii TaxID=2589797 RepID=A0A5B8BYK5_9MICO|nr:YdeI/OmpD-associated family protein [Georgenia yuyongxinii]QDC23323.1 hypothetical protein FE374_00570 [Georgenia yuyongxinii]